MCYGAEICAFRSALSDGNLVSKIFLDSQKSNHELCSMVFGNENLIGQKRFQRKEHLKRGAMGSTNICLPFKYMHMVKVIIAVDLKSLEGAMKLKFAPFCSH